MLLRRTMLLLLHMVGREAQQTTRELMMHLLLLQLLQVVDMPGSQLLLQLFATANHTVAQAKRAFDAVLQLTHTLLLLVLVVPTLLQHLQQVVAA
jgi:hypothetical protein